MNDLECIICCENYTLIVMNHIDKSLDIFCHKLCNNCYVNLTKPICPFCNMIIKHPLNNIITMEVDYYNNDFIRPLLHEDDKYSIIYSFLIGILIGLICLNI